MMTDPYAMPDAIKWLEQIEQISKKMVIDEVHVLLDQAGWINAALPVLRVMKPAVPWFSLFTGTPEENLLEQAPLLIRLNLTQPQHKNWLAELLCYCAEERLMVLISPLPFDELSKAARGLSQGLLGGRLGLLRYYDPRIFPVLMSSILTVEQRRAYLQLACYWSWLDRDAKPQWLVGGAGGHIVETVSPAGIELSDEQFNRLGCASDAHRLVNQPEFDLLEGTAEQQFSKLYAWALEASEHDYFGELAEYVRGKV